MITVPWNYPVVSQRYANVTSIPVVSRIFHKRGSRIPGRYTPRGLSFILVFAYRRVVKHDYLSSSNAPRASFMDAFPQRGCQRSTSSRLWYIAAYSTRVQTLVTSTRKVASCGSSIVSPPLRIRFLFHRVFFLFLSFLFPSTASLLTGGISLAGKLGWRHNGRPGITGSLSVLKSPSITRIGRLPTSNIIIIMSSSPRPLWEGDRRPTMARETREICLVVDTFDK